MTFLNLLTDLNIYRALDSLSLSDSSVFLSLVFLFFVFEVVGGGLSVSMVNWLNFSSLRQFQ